MLFVYVDESGDPSGAPTAGGSTAYVLGAVVVRAPQWNAAFNGLLELRRDLKKSFGIPVRAEIKASYLVQNDGPFEVRRIAASQRKYIYRRHLNVMSRLELRAFAVYVDKTRLETTGSLDLTRLLVWETLFQRLALMHDRDEPGVKTPIMLIHDEGEELTIRKYARRARRFLTAGSVTGAPLRLTPDWLIDDPVSRESDQSLLVQGADLVAYAATKRMVPGGSRSRRVCPASMWDALGDACHRPANQVAVRRDSSVPPGIVTGRIRIKGWLPGPIPAPPDIAARQKLSRQAELRGWADLLP